MLPSDSSWPLWAGFNGLVLLLLALDLGVFHRKSTVISVKQALLWTGFWVFLAFLFNVFVYYQFGEASAYQFFTGYVIEKSLSIDNIFIMVLIFTTFQVPGEYQHKILFWGVIGALVMRFAFILTGIELIHRFHFLIYIFGAFLIYTGIKLIVSSPQNENMADSPVIRILRRWLPITPDYVGGKFLVRQAKGWAATPLLVVLVLIEFTDLIFAVDSIPAILAITDDAFIVYTSNTFAILGLRSLYFALAGLEAYFKYLRYGLAIILVFVGLKMGISDWYKIPIELSLAFITLTMAVTFLTSMILKEKTGATSG